MACVGCAMADFMTLDDALDIYNLNEESFIEQLTQSIQSHNSDTE
jgi:hypothetical protein